MVGLKLSHESKRSPCMYKVPVLAIFMTAPKTAMRQLDRIFFQDFFVVKIVNWKEVHLICEPIYGPYKKCTYYKTENR